MSISIIADLNSSKSFDKYKTSGNNFPLYEKVDPKLKSQPDYCAQVAKAAFSNLMRDRTAVPGYSYTYMQNLRDYGTGNQSRLYYLNKIKEAETGESGTDTATSIDTSSSGHAKRDGSAGLNDQIVSIAINLKNAVHGMLEDYDEDIYINAIDNESGAEENRKMFESLFDDVTAAPFVKMMDQEYNVPLAPDSQLPQDVTGEEIVSYKETGGFKTFWAEAMEEAVQYTEQISNWDRVLKRKYIDDALDLNFISGRTVFDTSTGKEKWEYVDPANFCIQYSNDRLFRDAEYAGYFTLEKIGKLTEMGFSSDDLKNAAKNYQYLFENPTDVDFGRITATNSFSDRIMEFKVPVFHFSWIDVDVKKQYKYTSSRNKTTIKDLSFDEEMPTVNRNGKKKGIIHESLNTRVRKTYQCSWVVDTNMVYDYGLVPNQTRKSNLEPQLPFFAWRGITTNRKMIFGSIVESIVPFLDHLHMSWLKYQDGLAKSHPGGYAINLRLLQNLQMGGKKLDPLDAYKMFWKTGRFPYMDTPIGQDYEGGAVLPISRIEGTTGELMSVFQEQIRFVSVMIEKLTGINPVSMGATPDQDTGLGVQQMAAAGTNNVIRPIINGLFEMKELLATETSRRLPLLFRNVKKSREEYSRVIGPESVEVIAEAERNGAEYGLSLEARPSGEDKATLIRTIEEAMQRGRDGEASITLPQGMYIIERINNGGNFKKLHRQADFMIRKAQEEEFEKKRALIAEQSQQQGAQKEKEQQGEMQAKQVDHKMDVDLENVKFQHEIYLKQAEANIEYEKQLLAKRMELMSPQKVGI